MVKKKYFENLSVQKDAKRVFLVNGFSQAYLLPDLVLSKSSNVLKKFIAKNHLYLLAAFISLVVLVAITSYWLISLLAAPFILFFAFLSIRKVKFDLIKQAFDEDGIF